MPFGPDCQYEDFDACKRANADRDDPDAYCAAIQKRTEEHCMSNHATATATPAVVADGESRSRLRTVRRPVARLNPRWYQITAKADDEPTVIDIYDEIGWFGVTAADFVKDLRGVKASQIELHLNSPGGDVFDAIAIYNGLRQHKAQVHVIVDSLAASAASFIAMAGDKITAMANAMLMIHDPLGLVIGNATDMRELADLLDKHGDNIAAIYAARAGGDVAEWRERMLAETWYLADEAYKAGLVDEVDDADGRPIEDRWDLSVFTRDGITPDSAVAAIAVDEVAHFAPILEPSAATEDPPATEDPSEDEQPTPTDDAPEDVSTTAAPEASNGWHPATLGTTPPWFVPSSPRKETPQWQMR